MNISGNINSNTLIMALRPAKDVKNFPTDLASLTANAAASVDPASLVQTPEEAAAASKAASEKSIADFADYSSQTTAEKLQSAWLAQHGITKEEFDKMGPEEKKKVVAQMKEDIERQTRQAMEKKSGQNLNVLA